jgi:D-sedoheptulose 7-phosphate isomerase
MNYPEQYKAELVRAIDNIDSGRINQVIKCIKEASCHGRRIFICGSGGAAAASQFLVDMTKYANLKRTPRLRAMALNPNFPPPPDGSGDPSNDRVFVEQLKTFAGPGDVVVLISGSGNAPTVICALEYASWIGCRTISLTGNDGGKLAGLAEINVHVWASHAGSIEGALMAVCLMIGYYFIDPDQT